MLMIDTEPIWTNFDIKEMWYIVFKSEKVIENVDKLTEVDIIKFYVRYVDNTLLVIKIADISYVLNKFNIFDDVGYRNSLFYAKLETYFQPLLELFFYSLKMVYNKHFILKFPKEHIKSPTKKNL